MSDFEVRDRRRSSDKFEGEVCRCCQSRDVHVRDYGAMSKDCIEHFRKECAEKDALLQEAARLLEDVVMKEGWIRADKLARRIRESLGCGNG